MTQSNPISIIVPVYNEEPNIALLLERIDKTLKDAKLAYEVIFVDDYSTDKSAQKIKESSKNYPVKYYLKKGRPGKAQSLIEGFTYAKYELIAMIDADLQYSPEHIPQMIEEMKYGFDIVVANRKEKNIPFVRKILSTGFNYIFCKVLHGFQLDVQSGLKVFKKEVTERIICNPLPWSFDLEFLSKAKSAGYKISTIEITFHKRNSGASKVNIFTTSAQIALAAIALKLNGSHIIPLADSETKGKGFKYNQIEFFHFSELNIRETAVQTLLSHQTVFLFSIAIFLIAGLLLNWIGTITFLIIVITCLYFFDLLFNLFLIVRSFRKTPEIKIQDEELAQITEWPKYTIFCPLYKEWRVVSQFVKAINQLDYPKDKLQVQLLLEEDDVETIEHIKSYKLPSYFEIIVVPDTLPKTKPKACNYGLKTATGQYAVIYDAEDMPDPLQLKKAVVAFRKSGDHIACIQAKLNYYNKSQNLLTRLFTAEYSLWFNLILTGLQSLDAPIPLGGTSNHFRVRQLKEVKGWDSFNVTEDCDLGIRLAKKGYQTAILDSITLEEANSDLNNWLNQRSRWIKGYIQTYLVHMRFPKEFLKDNSLIHLFTFQITVGGKILSLFINPFMWLLTIAYFTLRSTLGPSIEQFFPGAVLYIGVFSLIAGNFLYMYYYMIACAKLKQYDLIKFTFLIPFYWLAMSIAAWKGLIQLIHKPHFWPKTIHGLHLDKDATDDTPQPKVSPLKRFRDFIVGKFVSKNTKEEVTKTWTFANISASSTFVGAMIVANFLNFLFNAYVGRELKYADFGLLTLVNTLSFIVSIVFLALTTTINHRVSYLTSNEGPAAAVSFTKIIAQKALKVTSIFSVIWLLITPLTMSYFHLDSWLPAVIILPIILFSLVGSVNSGFLNGSFEYISLAYLAVIPPVVKFLTAVYFMTTGQPTLVYLAIPISLFAPIFLATWFTIKKIRSIPSDGKRHLYKFPKAFYFSSILSALSVSSYITLDILLVQHFLPTQSGEYALLSLIGKMIYFFGSLVNVFLVAFVSRDEGAKRNPEKTFTRIFGITCFLTVLVFIPIGIFGKFFIPLLFGDKVIPVIPYLLVYSLAIVNITLSNTILTYHLTRHHYSFPIFALFITSLMIWGITIFHGSINQIILVMLITSCLHLVGMICLHFVKQNGTFVIKNIVDLFCLFLPLPKVDATDKRKKILIFNWRDIRHTFAGGAEVYLHELAVRWVKQGHKVVMFCGNDGHNPRNETIDGIQIVRRGGFYMVYVWAFLYYILRFRGRYDLIIDSENGIPFFTPLYASEKVYLLIHHVHQEVFRNSLVSPLASLATFLEIKVMPFVYKNVEVITVSESSKNEIMHSNISKREPHIIYNGVDLSHYYPGTKSTHPVILYLGRLKKYKNLSTFIKAAKEVLKQAPKAEFIIAGDGEEKKSLMQLAKKLEIDKSVHFLGKVTEQEKLELYQKSWIFVHPSFMEGWGITVLEANACGTPVVASNVPGLRDSVRNEQTGFLVTFGEENQFAEKILLLIKEKTKRETFSKNAIEWAKKFDWRSREQDDIFSLNSKLEALSLKIEAKAYEKN